MHTSFWQNLADVAQKEGPNLWKSSQQCQSLLLDYYGRANEPEIELLANAVRLGIPAFLDSNRDNTSLQTLAFHKVAELAARFYLRDEAALWAVNGWLFALNIPISASAPPPNQPITEDHEIECPHCGDDEIINEGTGVYECPSCGGDVEISLICPHCGEELEVEEWGETECPICGSSFNSWAEAKVTPVEEENDDENHEVECPHCGEDEIINAGTGIYECSDCSGMIEITLTCPHCGEELEVEEWSKTECPDCGTRFDSWAEAELTSVE